MASRSYGRLPAVEIVPPGGSDLAAVHDAYINIALTGAAGAEQRALFDAMGRRLIAERGCKAIMLGDEPARLGCRSQAAN